MPSCTCGFEYIEGAITCWQCGEMLTEQSLAPMNSIGRRLSLESTTHTCSLLLFSCFGVPFQEGKELMRVPLKTLIHPIRIGRRDENQTSPIIPDIDLTTIIRRYWSEGVKSPISRSHAVLELRDGRLCITHLVEKNRSTSLRHTGEKEHTVLLWNVPTPLTHKDVLYLGHSSTGVIKIRVLII